MHDGVILLLCRNVGSTISDKSAQRIVIWLCSHVHIAVNVIHTQSGCMISSEINIIISQVVIFSLILNIT